MHKIIINIELESSLDHVCLYTNAALKYIFFL